MSQDLCSPWLWCRQQSQGSDASSSRESGNGQGDPARCRRSPRHHARNPCRQQSGRSVPRSSVFQHDLIPFFVSCIVGLAAGKFVATAGILTVYLFSQKFEGPPGCRERAWEGIRHEPNAGVEEHQLLSNIWCEVSGTSKRIPLH